MNLGARGLNDGLAPLFDVALFDVGHPAAGPKAREDGALALTTASRSEDDDDDTKKKFDVMIAKQQAVVDGKKNRGHTKGMPQTGGAAKKAPKTGKHAAGKGATNSLYVDIPGRLECATAGCTAMVRANGFTRAGTQRWRKTSCK